MPAEKLVRVFTAASELEASVVQGLLGSAGIESLLDSHAPTPVLPFALSKTGQIHVLVPESQAAEAERIIAEQEEQAPEEGS